MYSKLSFAFLFCAVLFSSIPSYSNAQVANTGWPTTFHDMLRSNRTNAIGPQTRPSVTKWRKSLPQRFGGGSLRGATIGTNGRSIYLAGGFNGVYSLNKNTGAVEWQRLAETGMGATACPPALSDNEKWVDMGPTISSDGTLFVTAEYGWGMALDPEIGGTENGLKYKFYLCKTEQAVAMDNGSMYAGSWDGKFFAYNIGGNASGTSTNPKDHSTSRRKWTYKFANAGRLYTYGTPAIGNDGTIYFGFKGIYAFHPDAKCTDPIASCAAQRKWYAQIGRALESAGAIPYNGVTLGPEGNIYINHGNSIFVVDKNGPVTNTNDIDSQYLWEFVTGANTRGRAPAIGADGTVYVGSDDGYLYAFNPSTYSESRPKNSEFRPVCLGNSTNPSAAWCVKWKFRLGSCQAYSNSMVDGNGTIYINTNCDGGKGRLYAVNPNGTEKWQFNTATAQGFLHDQQISMDSDGTIFFNSGQNEFAALAGGPVDPNTTPTPTRTPTPTPIIRKPGDATGDGIINVQDYNILVTQFNQTGTTLTADFNNSGKVDVQDYNILVTNFGR
jgi:outer membrane protein assembly factor BamB